MLYHISNHSVNKENCIKTLQEAFKLTGKHGSDDIYIFASKLGVEKECISHVFGDEAANKLKGVAT